MRLVPYSEAPPAVAMIIESEHESGPEIGHGGDGLEPVLARVRA
jgi:hypothetical protein